LVEKNFSDGKIAKPSFFTEAVSEMHFSQNYGEMIKFKGFFLNGLIAYRPLIILVLAI